MYLYILTFFLIISGAINAMRSEIIDINNPALCATLFDFDFDCLKLKKLAINPCASGNELIAFTKILQETHSGYALVGHIYTLKGNSKCYKQNRPKRLYDYDENWVKQLTFIDNNYIGLMEESYYCYTNFNLIDKNTGQTIRQIHVDANSPLKYIKEKNEILLTLPNGTTITYGLNNHKTKLTNFQNTIYIDYNSTIQSFAVINRLVSNDSYNVVLQHANSKQDILYKGETNAALPKSCLFNDNGKFLLLFYAKTKSLSTQAIKILDVQNQRSLCSAYPVDTQNNLTVNWIPNSAIWAMLTHSKSSNQSHLSYYSVTGNLLAKQSFVIMQPYNEFILGIMRLFNRSTKLSYPDSVTVSDFCFKDNKTIVLSIEEPAKIIEIPLPKMVTIAILKQLLPTLLGPQLYNNYRLIDLFFNLYH